MAEPSSDEFVSVGTRTYIPSNEGFGSVSRTSFLGLKNSPVVTMDDGSVIALAGQAALKDVVPTATKKNALNEEVNLPLDIRVVGIDLLTAHGVDADTQALMFSNYITKLSKAQRAQYTAAFDNIDQSDPAKLTEFLDNMVATMSAL